MGRITYTPMPGARILFPLAFLVFAGFAVFLIASTATGARHTPPPWFTILWLLAGAWNAFVWLWLASYRLEFAGTTLTWTTPLRSGTVSVDQIVAFRPMMLIPQFSVVEVSNGPNIVCATVAGFTEFATAVVGDRPIPVRTSLFERFNRTAGGSGFRRED